MRALVCGFLLLVAAVTAGKVKPPEGEYAPKCLVGTPGIYDPSNADEVPWYDVDLDAEPEEHYKKIVKDHIPGINRVIDIIKEMVNGVLGVLGDTTDIIGILETLSQDAFLNKIPKTYQREIQGIADATGVTTADLTMMNMYYELSRFCTSIIAQGADGTMYHARNLDFGQLFVWNVTTRSWALTDALKTVTININFMRGGKVLYKATTFAGHLGIITGMKPNAFTLSMNAKVKSDLAAVIQYLTGDVPDIHFAMWADREVMEQANTFEEARDFLSKIQQLAGCYYILGGAKPGQGTIIVRNETGVMQEKTLDGSPDKWFILQTNYDPDQVPLFIDDRQEPGESCMRTLSQKNLSPEGIYQVLASKTTLNKTTAHMVIMSLTTGLYETFIMYCADPCWFL